MSYILSALRKAEKDRENSTPVTSESFIAGEAPGRIEDRKPASARWAGVAAVLVVGLALGIAVWQLSGRDTAPPAVSAEEDAAGTKSIGYRPTVAEEKPIEQVAPDTGPPASESAELNGSVAPASVPETPLPDLNITGYIFFEGEPARSKLFVDGIVYRQGSRLGTGLILTGFAPDHVTVSHRGRERTVPVD